ncbi:MAG: hypothetical protein ACI4WR_01025, partial [Bulleidia sp.]
GNLIRNLARLCHLPLSENEDGMLVIRGEVPCYIDGKNEEVWIFRLGNAKVANIYRDGRIEMKASIPAISKTLMSQTRDYRLSEGKTIFKTYIRREVKFHSDLHTHMNGNLMPDILIALGIVHQIRYPLYYVRKLGLKVTDAQQEMLDQQRKQVARQFVHSDLKGKYLDRKINDNTFINFADLMLRNPQYAEENLVKIRNSLAVMKDGQAVFTNLEKVYLYRYVFCKGKESEYQISLKGIENIPDPDVRQAAEKMLKDHQTPAYAGNTIFQDKLLWIARQYAAQGITYAEISDTTLVKEHDCLRMLSEVHAAMPAVTAETGVTLRFLAAMRRIPLTIVKDQIPPADYLSSNLNVLKAVSYDPYVAGCDIVGEEISDIIELKPMFRELVKIPARDPSFVIRIHAGENDSLRDNMAHSIACVKDSLSPGQPMPIMRLGHGLYSCGLHTKKGKELLRDLKKYHITLEFQITSNVRLNNLNSLASHPLRSYLREGISCVQGTDGAALYGTSPIDEQLSLEKLLDLSYEELKQMHDAEAEVIEQQMRSFEEKQKAFRALQGSLSPEETILRIMQNQDDSSPISWRTQKRIDSYQALKDQIKDYPWDREPVVLAGGSFNTQNRMTHVTEKGAQILDAILEKLDPEEVFFVIGHQLTGYERYLTEHNAKGFLIFAVVPSMLEPAQIRRLKKAGVSIRVSPESEDMGIYKSFNYEIFERRPSVVIGFDGNSAGANLIQEAKNGKGKASIFVYSGSRGLKEKAESLEGYVTFFEDECAAEKVRQALQKEPGS